MKKLYVLLLIFLLVGCGKDKDIKLYETYDDEYYKIYTPYKERVGTYFLKTTNNINLEEVENMLMDLSKTYFDKNKLYYMEGQYLDNDFLKELLESSNDFKEITISNNKVKPKYITGIYEQNYLNSEGKLNGISLGIVLNPYQTYINSSNIVYYKNVDIKEMVDNVNDKMEFILSKVREIEELKNIKIMVGLFIQESPNSTLPGGYKYYGITADNKIDFKEVNYKYYDLDKISEIDSNNYEAYISLKDELNKLLPNIYVSGYALYREEEINKMTINITYNGISRSTILYINQMISEEVIPNFSSNINIKVYIKNNNRIMSMVFKEKNNVKSTIYLVD